MNKYSASVDFILRIEYDEIEADSEEEAKKIAIEMAYQDIDFNNCSVSEDTANAYIWPADE